MGVICSKSNKLYHKLHQKIMDRNHSIESLDKVENPKYEMVKEKLLDKHYHPELEDDLG